MNPFFTNHRNRFLRIVSGATLLAITFGLHAVTPAQAAGILPTKPNIVFILIDDMGWPDVGCYGNKFHETPTIDIEQMRKRYESKAAKGK